MRVMLPRLPLDLSSFRKLREQGFLYIDKTQHAYNLIIGGYRYFLSRPRRFGKSLFVSTLKEILLGEKELFNGLWISSSGYQFKKHGVISLDFSLLGIKTAENFERGVCHALSEIAEDYELNVVLDEKTPELALRVLVRALRKKFNGVAILIDEYDYPIFRSLHDEKNAKEMRDSIRSFFASIKGFDEEVDFVFITGVSSFAKAGLFSGLNNLRIITLDKKYDTICGYSDVEIDHYFNDYLNQWAGQKKIDFDDLRNQVKEWYNGYSFGSDVIAIYNPFSVINSFEINQFKNFWFQSGTPTFLIEQIKKKCSESDTGIFDLEKIKVSEESLGIFDVGATPLAALMFQTGYLTIKDYNYMTRFYSLGYPNFEVKTSLEKHILEYSNRRPQIL